MAALPGRGCAPSATSAATDRWTCAPHTPWRSYRSVPDVDRPHHATARPHPDLLFALRLSETPAAADPVDR
ncbi:hypothetical protein [Micromonospora sp. NPDC003776]